MNKIFSFWKLKVFPYQENRTQDPESTQDLVAYEEPGPYEYPQPYKDAGA